MEITLLDTDKPQFPSPDRALTDPNGLLAIGGNLHPDTLLSAYQQGIFPWFCDDEPLLWWSPDPRAVIFPDQLYVSRSLAKLHRQQRFQVTIDRAFSQVMDGCSAPRKGSTGTWITAEMRAAYTELFHGGHAHSVEVWNGRLLAGGLYGVAVGAVFCGESMFSRTSNASKLALISLLEMVPGIRLIDCQIPSEHLKNLGAKSIPRKDFLKLLEENRIQPVHWPN